ncbi:MAG TPA: SHOCT domain-containing protein [Streptosporangiaceae bacterium]|nr:SHOCT domain-containing protein [Streptosporangiaceae bacterium]
MFMRRRPLMRAAVVGGGAYMAGKHMANKANEQAAQDDYQNQRLDQVEQQQQYQQPPQYQQQQQYAPPPQQAPPPDAAPAAGPSVADQLQQIAGLHQQGVLSDDEFAAAKAKILGGG